MPIFADVEVVPPIFFEMEDLRLNSAGVEGGRESEAVFFSQIDEAFLDWESEARDDEETRLLQESVLPHDGADVF